MAINLRYYLVPASMAARINSRMYRTADGRYVADSRLLRQAGISPEDGGIEQVSRNEALTLIARGGYQNE